MFSQPRGYVWHYTAASHLPAIAQSGGLHPSCTQLNPVDAARAILWFSRQQQWEPSVPRPEIHVRQSHGGRSLRLEPGLYRFGLPQGDLRLLPWPAITRVADLEVPEAMTMVSGGLRHGATPTDWLGTLSAVPLADLRFQAWDGHAWVDADLHAAELASRRASKDDQAAAARRAPPVLALASHDVF